MKNLCCISHPVPEGQINILRRISEAGIAANVFASSIQLLQRKRLLSGVWLTDM